MGKLLARFCEGLESLLRPYSHDHPGHFFYPQVEHPLSGAYLQIGKKEYAGQPAEIKYHKDQADLHISPPEEQNEQGEYPSLKKHLSQRAAGSLGNDRVTDGRTKTLSNLPSLLLILCRTLHNTQPKEQNIKCQRNYSAIS